MVHRPGLDRRATYDETRRLDPTRPVTPVGLQQGVREWHGLFDVVCVNAYYSWYTRSRRLDLGFQALARELDELHKALGKPIIITEFGTDTLPGAHNQPPEMWTEEFQTDFIRGYLYVAAERAFMAGMHVWNFADFKTGQGTTRAAGIEPQGRIHPRPPAEDGSPLPAVTVGREVIGLPVSWGPCSAAAAGQTKRFR